MRSVVFGFLLFIFSQNVSAAGCGQNCTDSTDCTGGCATCYAGKCASCCDALANDQGECEDNFPGCTWNTTEGVCEDIPNAGCANGIPEAPMNEFRWGWMVLAGLIVGLGLWWRKKRLKTSH